jgi:hypothetical protein
MRVPGYPVPGLSPPAPVCPSASLSPKWLRDCLRPGSQTQGSIEIAAERDGVCIATLRCAKFDIGVRSSKDGKSGGWWCFAASGALVPSSQPGKMLKLIT